MFFRVAFTLVLLLVSVSAQAQETLTIRFGTSVGPDPKYAPRNVVAVWVETAAGAFVKTIGRWADKRRSEMTTWASAAGSSDSDAVMGATRKDHSGTLTVTWDMSARAGGTVSDGSYAIKFESADRNGGASSNLWSYAFQKDGIARTDNTSGGGFTNVVVDYSGRTDGGVPPPRDSGIVVPGDGAVPPRDAAPGVDASSSSDASSTSHFDAGTAGQPPIDGCACQSGGRTASGTALSVLLLLLLGARCRRRLVQRRFG